MINKKTFKELEENYKNSTKGIAWEEAKKEARRVAEISGNNNPEWIEKTAVFYYNEEMQNQNNIGEYTKQ